MPQVLMKDQIKKLVELQALDVDIYRFKKEVEEKPLALEELRKHFESKKASLKALEEQLKRNQVDRKGSELELQAKEGDIVKANGQLMQLKTNKEYSAKLLEIENMKADKSVFEEKILIFYDESDKINVDITKEKGILAEEEKKYLAKQKEVGDTVKEVQEKLAVLEMKRKQVFPDVDKGILSRYERILENKEGLAIVPLKDRSCGGCFMSIPDQVVNEIKMYEQLIFCEMCARILYLEDDVQ